MMCCNTCFEPGFATKPRLAAFGTQRVGYHATFVRAAAPRFPSRRCGRRRLPLSEKGAAPRRRRGSRAAARPRQQRYRFSKRKEQHKTKDEKKKQSARADNSASDDLIKTSLASVLHLLFQHRFTSRSCFVAPDRLAETPARGNPGTETGCAAAGKPWATATAPAERPPAATKGQRIERRGTPAAGATVGNDGERGAPLVGKKRKRKKVSRIRGEKPR